MATSGSASSSCTWTPKDDVLLKNAMQEGASFEVLAKGVVPFSHRYTFQELRDRWHSLLYDPDVAAQASVSMFQLELSGFNPVLKLEQLRSFNYKETLGKRNRGSIRQHYRTMRKKLRKGSSNLPDFSLLEESRVHDSKEGSHGEKYMIRNGIQDHFELLREADVETIHHAFPEHRNVSVRQFSTEAQSSYVAKCFNKGKERSSNKLIRKDGFLDAVYTSLNNNLGIFEPRREPRGVSRFMKNNSVEFNEASSVERQQLSSESLQPLSGFGSAKHDCSNGFLGLHQGDPLNSPNGNSFNVLGFPFPQPTLPLWEPIDELSVAQPPEKLKHVDAAPGSRDCTVKDSSIYDVVPTGPLLDASHDGAALVSNPSVVAEGEDISDSLLNLSNEDDLLLLDVDKKEGSQKSSSGNHNSVLINDIPKDSAGKLESQMTVSETSPVDHTTATSKLLDGFQNLYEPAFKGSSRSVSKVDDEKICCVLNTEDPEIPCNDDIFLLIHQSASYAFDADPPRPISRDPVDVSCTFKQKQSVKGINMVTKGKGIAKESTWPQKIVPTVMPEAHLVKPVRFGVKTDCSDTGALTLPPLPGGAKPAFAGPTKSRSLLANPSISTSRLLNEDLPKFDSKARDNLAAFSEPQSAERGAVMIPFPGVIPSASDHEESQSDDDVPCYSDIEAMIHEMDLVPFDLDNTTAKQVSRYQHESSDRTIIRLEECAQACLQRAMARHGAFAVFYGRHVRHYIRKTEVLLGRSTDDFDVDIDLSEEGQGRANKISRRQAIIKLENGSFSLKNLGKSEIFVNGKSVATGQLLGLSSSCLIEVTYRAAFGSSKNDGQDEFIQILQEFSKLFGEVCLGDFIPCLSWIDPQGMKSRLVKAREALDGFIDSIIDDHLHKKNGLDGVENDMVDELLAFYGDEISRFQDLHGSMRLTRDNIKAIIMDVIFGGTETVASAIEWAMAELMRSPTDLKTVQKELQDVVGLDRKVEDTDFDKLPYLNSCLKETLRLHPPIPVLFHETANAAEVFRFRIPKKSHVMINVWAIGRDKSFWKEPETFQPSRFMNDCVPDFKGKDFEFIPFGSGRRSCPGMQLGFHTIQMAVAHLLHCFNWELPNGMNPSELDMDDMFGLTAPRASRLVAVPTQRLQCPIFTD